MSNIKPLEKFLVKPYGDSEYVREKKGVIVTSSIENHMDVNRVGVIVDTPISYEGDIKPGDLVVIHHNIFRSYYDMKGYERKSREYFKDNLYLVDENQIYLVKKNNNWNSFDNFCFVTPKKEAEALFSLGEYESNQGFVSFSNKHLERMSINKGDEVAFVDDSEYEFEIDEVKMYRMKTKDICIKFN
jgi:co-chaperonin GroES (HSP10)